MKMGEVGMRVPGLVVAALAGPPYVHPETTPPRAFGPEQIHG
jgi:hypothetical protein